MHYIIKQVIALSTCMMLFSGTFFSDFIPAAVSDDIDIYPDVSIYDDTIAVDDIDVIGDIDNMGVLGSLEISTASGRLDSDNSSSAIDYANSSSSSSVTSSDIDVVTTDDKRSDGTVTLMFTGDLMCQPNQQEAGFDGSTYSFDHTFKYVKRIFNEADLVIGNLETLVSSSLPLSKDMPRLQDKPYLNSPSEFLDALANAGFDGFILANNHNCDGGAVAIRETLEELDKREFLHTGLFSSKDDKRYFIADVEGIKVGIISYARYFNQKDIFLTEEEQSYMLNRTLEQSIKADVNDLKKEGAEYIIAYNHCGDEYSQIPADRQIRYAHMFADAGVDYLIGSHPHVLQPFQMISHNGKDFPVIHSMGNFISSMKKEIPKETIILSLTLKRDNDGKIVLAEQTYYPCYMMDYYQGEHYVLMPENQNYNDGFSSKKLSEAFDHIREIVGTEYFTFE